LSWHRNASLGVRLFVFLIGVACATSFAFAEHKPATCSVVGAQEQSDWQLVDKSRSNHVCVKPGVNWDKYSQYQIEPSIYVPTDPHVTLKPGDADKMTSLFDAQLHEAYKHQLSGAGATLKIKPIITGIKRSNSH
jgi:hypothetical protein